MKDPFFWLLIISLPLLYINVRPDHDWGGDFAQYIKQAENIANGNPYFQTKYVFNEAAPVYGPPAYPPGFSILLAPVVKVWGLSFQVLTIYQSVFLILFGLISFGFFKKHFQTWLSVLLALMMLYNPWILSFKSEIMSDIVFSFLFILTFYLYRFRKDNRLFRTTYLGLLIAFTILLRSIGLVLPLALTLRLLSDFIRGKWFNKTINKENRKFDISLLIFSVVIFALLKYIVFPLPLVSEASYLNFLSEGFSLQGFLSNLSYYLLMIKNLFPTLSGEWIFLSILLSSFVIVLIFLGIARQAFSNPGFIDLVFAVYVLILLIYPYQGSGFRFLLPVFPFLMFYLVSGVKIIKTENQKVKEKTLLVFMLIALLTFAPGILNIIKKQDTVKEGPHKPKSQEVFRFIKNNTNENACIAFIRPRVLALFTDRYSMGTKYQDSVQEIGKQYQKYDVDYILQMNLLYDNNVSNYISANRENLELVFKNNDFNLYKMRTNSSE
ncbi:MAG: glycosyltransferase family 39 protein [Bacteroidota bacterium]|nr:glycosyltransferase family 39 protein [Bacteroidota bacterium]